MASIGVAENVVQKWKVPELKLYLQSPQITVLQKRCDSHQVADERRFAVLSQHITLWLDFWLFQFSELHKQWQHIYLINKEGYDHESQKAYKYCLFWDGHGLKLMKNKNLFSGYHYIKFGVKPTEWEKTQVGHKPTYDGWITIQSDGSVYTAHCPCTGGWVFLLPRVIFGHLKINLI